MTMMVRDVMTSPAITVLSTCSVRQAIRLLYANEITAAPVVDTGGRLAGVVSELDLLRGEFEPDPRASLMPVLTHHEPPPRTVADVMTREVITVTETTDAITAIDLMVTKRIKSLPVRRADRVVGILSRRDLMAMLARPDEELREAIMVALHEQYPFGPSWQVSVRDGIATLRGKSNPYADGIADVIASTVPGVVRVKHRSQP